MEDFDVCKDGEQEEENSHDELHIMYFVKHVVPVPNQLIVEEQCCQYWHVDKKHKTPHPNDRNFRSVRCTDGSVTDVESTRK